MYTNGQHLCKDFHFWDHLAAGVPVQIYHQGKHNDIGLIETFNCTFVKVNNNLYHREHFTFVSRPGY